MGRRSRTCIALVAVVVGGVVLQVSAGSDGEECTTLVAGGAATVAGGPLLWKNRDTATLSNKVVFVTEQPHSFLALIDADDTAAHAAWAGVNVVGFAVANSASYNLPEPAGEARQQEGRVMAEALRTCRTVDDFEALLARRQGRRLGVRANFFALDATGGAAIIETHNGGHTRYDAASFPHQRLANTNFSRSGGRDEGAGYLRFDRESEILASLGALDASTIFDVLARDLSHPLLRHPGRDAWKDLPAETPYWIHTNYTIDRPSTASAVVVQGVRPGNDPKGTVMWVALGEPVTTIAVPLWVAAGTPPPELWRGKDAPISAEAARLKGALRPLKARERFEYADLSRLDNAAGTGWLPGLLTVEREIASEAAAYIATNPPVEGLAAFQQRMATRALAALKAIDAAPRVDSPAPSHTAPIVAEGAVLQRDGEHARAVAAFDLAIAASPQDAGAHLLKCRSLAGLRQYEAAVAACSESLRWQPNVSEALRDRGHYYLNLGRIELGLADLLKAASIARRDRGVYYHLGLAHYLLGDFASAATAYESCVATSDTESARVECQAWLLPSLLRAGRRQDARTLLAGIQVAPLGGHSGLYLDRLLLFKGVRTEAQVAATMSSEGAVTEATVGYNLGLWHLLNGRRAEARVHFQRSLASKLETSWGARASEAELRRLGNGPGSD